MPAMSPLLSSGVGWETLLGTSPQLLPKAECTAYVGNKRSAESGMVGSRGASGKASIYSLAKSHFGHRELPKVVRTPGPLGTPDSLTSLPTNY